MHSTSYQATVGKLALGIKVSDLTGRRIGFGRSTGRVFAEFLAGLTLGIGFVMAGFTKRRQALSDMIAGTLVVKKNVTADEIAANPIAPKVPAWAATLLILAGGLGPIGILAAIAIPAYQDYSVRAEVTDALTSASTYKAVIAESIANGAAWEDITTESLGPGAQANSQYLQSSEVYGGVIVLTFGQNASSAIAGKQLVLVPGVANDGSVVWVCGYAKAPYGVELALDEHTKYTDAPSKYLPSACR
jgi:Tfp pilus assembly major pilin PilA